MINRTLLKKYNLKDAVIVISSYPKKAEKYSSGVCAVAGYTKNTLKAMQLASPTKKIIVLTMELNKKEMYEEDNMLIIRCFKRNSLLSYWQFFRYAKLFSNIPSVLIEFEFASFGDTRATAGLLPLTWALHLLGKKTTLVAHQIIFDLSKLAGHIGMKNDIKISLFNALLTAYYKILLLPITHVVVLEDYLKKRLSHYIKEEKITIIPHGVDTTLNNHLDQKRARKKLGLNNKEIIILYFGYLTWYKGADFLLETLRETKQIQGRPVRVILAGGTSFTQKNKSHYQSFIKRLKTLTQKHSHLTITGFVKEKNIPLYFQGADLVLFPYRTFMSSSGPLSIAFAMQKPVLLSRNVRFFLESKDIASLLKRTSLRPSDLLFTMNKEDLLTKITYSLEKKQYIKMKQLSKLIGEERSFVNLSWKYLDLVNHKYTKLQSLAIQNNS